MQQISPQEAYRLIEAEFIQIGLQPHSILTAEELFAVLDKKLGKQFDRGVAVQLVDQLDKDNLGRFKLSDFIGITVEARTILFQKSTEATASIENFEHQKADTQQQLQVQEREERFNQHGIMLDSILIVQELELADIHNANGHQVYVRLNYENNAFQTERQVYRQGARWDDQFKVQVERGDDDIQFIVYLFEREDVDSHILGGVGIPIDRLRDQQQHDEWFDLYDQNGNISGGKMRASLHWIHSRVKYLNALIAGYDEHIAMLIEDQRDHQRDLNTIHELFPSLVGGQIGKLFSFDPKNSVPQGYVDSYGSLEDQKFGDLESRQKPVPAKPAKPAIPAVSAVQVDIPVIYEQGPEVRLTWANASLSGLIGFYTSIALVILGIFGCFLKPDFIDIVLGVAFLVLFNLKRRFTGTAKWLLILVAVTVAAIVLEIIWISLYGSRWSHPAIDGTSQPALRFTIVIRIFSVIVKFILAIAHFMFYRYLINNGIMGDNVSLTAAAH